MTKEEAIRELEKNKNYPISEPASDEAIEMAIEALQQETCHDAISRQAAIDAIWDGINMDIYTREVKECLENLPPVKTERGHKE